MQDDDIIAKAKDRVAKEKAEAMEQKDIDLPILSKRKKLGQTKMMLLSEIVGRTEPVNVQELYMHGAEYERTHDSKKLEELGNIIASLDASHLVAVAKSFTHMLNLANLPIDVQMAHPTRITNLKKGALIQGAFRTDEIQRVQPTPQDEMRGVMNYIHETIWKGVPKFLHRIDTALKNIGINEHVPYNAPLIWFSSWMGGDQDGNPRVTGEVTKDVCLLARMVAATANLYFSQIDDLMFELKNKRPLFGANIPKTEEIAEVLGIFHVILDLPPDSLGHTLSQWLLPLQMCLLLSFSNVNAILRIHEGRGGGPTHLTLLSQPPNTINGSLRVTVQGEVIEQAFAEEHLCFKTLERYITATLVHGMHPAISPLSEWHALLDQIAVVAIKDTTPLFLKSPNLSSTSAL
ncbi:hypothetical protein Cgig2_001275 [Carnegiea gigantea]|uniref:Phosphoenolpyruvate carboxylase n=1 Tax=Carnegiea gigantea TaxID=171969 RepID=A0A9Q1KMF8_9CARY|nr:hypothetical protein Cgig2_001275 [Carnegiea gigantea]